MSDNTILCPRCESRRYMPYGQSRAPQGGNIQSIAHPPALSRMDNKTYICHDCGNDEAMRDMQGMAPIPPTEWPVLRSPEFGMGSTDPTGGTE